MANCRDEFLKHTHGKHVLCSKIHKGDPDYRETETFVLPIGYTDDQARDFLESLNFGYDSGYGGQELYGHIWYTDGTWSDRGEYDGSEWWEHQKMPEIPAECKETPSDV